MMAFNHRPLSIFRVVLLVFGAITLAADETNKTRSGEKVGWKQGPNTRGTLNLVWSCGITIFACTWTVTHLNVPAPDDTSTQIFLRRVKWMAINVLFPELILSKAVCDLRQALDELRQFEENLPRIRHQVTIIPWMGPDREEMFYQRSWKVRYPPCYKMLYRLFRLDLPGSQAVSTSSNEAGDSDRSQSQQDSQLQGCDERMCRPEIVDHPREWTIVHSYFAQMGGILMPRATVGPNERKMYRVLTATHLTARHEWKVRGQVERDFASEHPLKYLELSQEDIQDKSKADALLKSIAILQIAWLVLDVAVRAATGLHVSQLEMATLAFAIMAILTYFASWWKPKDVSQATRIHPRDPMGSQHAFDGSWISKPSIISLSHWFHSPDLARALANFQYLYERSRVPNDLTWMRAEGPSMILLLAVSCLLFGCLHLIAWDFEFPSQAELVAWRIGCVIIAVLPVIVLAVNMLLVHLLTERFDKQRRKILTRAFDKLPTMSQDWWERTLNSNILDSYIASIPADRAEEIQIFKENPQHEPLHQGYLLESISRDLCSFVVSYKYHRRIWIKALEDGKLESNFLFQWTESLDTATRCWETLGPHFREFWRQFEIFANESAHNPNLGAKDIFYTEKLLQAYKTVYSRLKREYSFYWKVQEVPRLVSLMSYIIYSAARLLVVVLLFTSLRSLPADTYQVTSWVNYLLKIF